MSTAKKSLNTYILPSQQNLNTVSDKFPGNLTREQLKENGFLETRSGLDPRNDLNYPIQSTFTQWQPDVSLDDDDSPLSAADAVALVPIWRLVLAFLNRLASILYVYAIMYGPRNKNGSKNYKGNAAEGKATAK